MAISQRLDLRQAQSLVMTPQLQQAIKLLELSNQDLAAYVEEELERNPLLERADDSEREAPAEAASDSGDADGRDPDRMLDTKEFGDREHLPDAKESPIDADYDNVYTGNGAGEGAADFGEPSGQANWRVGAGRGDFPDEDG